MSTNRHIIMRKLINRAQAALILGVTPQTVTNYVKRGLLTGIPRKYGTRQIVRLYEDEVRERAKGLTAISLSEKEFVEYRQQAEALAASAKASYHEVLQQVLGAKTAHNTIRHIVDVLAVVVDKMTEWNGRFTEKDKEILSWLLSTGNVGKTAHLTKFSREGVRLRALKALRRLAESEEATKMISDLKARCQELEKENAALRRTVKDSGLTVDIDAEAQWDSSKKKILGLKLTDFPMSVRTWNCCRQHKVFTVADLVKRTRNDVASFRNLGNKSLAELDSILNSLGLWYGASAS